MRGKTIICGKVGCRAREYLPRLLQFYAALDALRQDFVNNNEVHNEISIEISQQSFGCITLMLGEAQLKFAFVFQPPYTIWQCDDPAEARKFITTVKDQIAKDPKSVHRVSAYFVLEGDGCLGTDMETHASNNGCSPELRTEMTVYQFLGRHDILSIRENHQISK